MSSNCSTCSETNCNAKTRRSNETDAMYEQRQRIIARLCRIKVKLLVMSGKGGVGKSTMAVNLAAALAARGHQVGLMDVDIHGPSIPTLVGLSAATMETSEQGIVPIQAAENLKVMSIGFWLDKPETAVIWRGPKKLGLIRQFVSDVDWGDLDFLIVDAPPGTGDEPLGAAQTIEGLNGAVIVTTPQQVAINDVQRSIGFCRDLNLPVTGVVENMSGFACPHCHEVTEIFKSGGGRQMADNMQVPFLGAVPIDPQLVMAGDSGKPYIAHTPDTATAKAIDAIVEPIAQML